MTSHKNIILPTLISISTLSPFLSNAQKVEVSAFGGLSLPMGNFSKGNYDDLKSGFAKTGYEIGLSGSYFFNKNWGATLTAGQQNYGFKNATAVAAGYKNAFDLDDATFSTDGRTQSYKFLLGPTYRYTINPHWYIDINVSAGVAFNRLAGNSVALEDVSTIIQKTANKTSFAFQPQADVNYQFNKHWALGLGVNYFYTKPNFSVENENRNNNAGRLITEYKEPFQAVNAHLALTYKF